MNHKKICSRRPAHAIVWPMIPSWECWPTGVCSARRQCTYQTAAFQSVKLLHGGIYAPLHVINWPYLDIVSALTVGGHLLSLVRRCLTLCLMIYEILQSAHRPSDYRWRLIFSLPISTFSALGVSRNALYKCTIFSYLLTYFTNRAIDPHHAEWRRVKQYSPTGSTQDADETFRTISPDVIKECRCFFDTTTTTFYSPVCRIEKKQQNRKKNL